MTDLALRRGRLVKPAPADGSTGPRPSFDPRSGAAARSRV